MLVLRLPGWRREHRPRSAAEPVPGTHAIRHAGLRANFLIGIREDALAKLDTFKGRIPGLFANSLGLDRLDRKAGETAIVGPVNAYNALVPPEERVEVEPELVAAVLEEV